MLRNVCYVVLVELLLCLILLYLMGKGILFSGFINCALRFMPFLIVFNLLILCRFLYKRKFR